MAFENTANYAQYHDYKNLKERWQFIYKNLNLIDAISIDLIEILVCSHQKTWRNVVDMLWRRLYLKPLYEILTSSKTLFSCDVPQRKDHLRLVQLMQESVYNSRLNILSYYFIPWFDVPFLVRSMCAVHKHVPASVSLVNRMFLSAKLVYFARLTSQLNKQFSDLNLADKNYVPFNSSAYTEALLTAFFNEKGTTTFHVFHGIFGRYLTSIPNDVVNGENLRTTKILTFSDMQKKDLHSDFGVLSNKMFVAGNPKYPYRSIHISGRWKTCLVLGGIADYDQSLIALLHVLDRVAAVTHIDFFLKPHPHSHILDNEALKQYKSIQILNSTKTLQELLASNVFDFAVTCNTSAYYECMYYGVVPFRWSVDENINFHGFDDKFDNEESFMTLMDKYIHEDYVKLVSRMEQLLSETWGVGINNYGHLII